MSWTRCIGLCVPCTLYFLMQETESEYAGVRSPLLRIYNEEGAHLT